MTSQNGFSSRIFAVVFTAFPQAEDLIDQRSSFRSERLRNEGPEQQTSLPKKRQSHRCSLSLTCRCYYLLSMSKCPWQARESVSLHTSQNENASNERLDPLLILAYAFLAHQWRVRAIPAQATRFSRSQIDEMIQAGAVFHGPLPRFSGFHLQVVKRQFDEDVRAIAVGLECRHKARSGPCRYGIAD